jgi:anti-sigma-K factor RskA
MTDTDHDRRSEDLAAYVLGALEPERAAELERHAEGCERCRSEMRWLTPAVQALPESVERMEPPPQLRARLMAEVAADGGEAARAAGGPQDSKRGRGRTSAWLRRLGSGPMGLRPVAGVAVAVLVVAAVAGYAIGGGIGGGSDAGGGTSTIATGKAPGITATMVDEGDFGTLRLANVRQLPNDKVLEAWVQRDGEVEAVPALFVPDNEGRASTQLPNMEGVEVVMVTAEPKGGSEAPTSAPLVTLSIPQ